MLLKTHISQREEQSTHAEGNTNYGFPWASFHNFSDLPRWKQCAVATVLAILLSSILIWQFWQPTPSILIPQSNSPFQYYLLTATDAEDPNSTALPNAEGDVHESTLNVQSSEQRLIYDFTVSETTLYPYATLGYSFSPQNKNHNYVDLSKLESATFNVSCAPATKLTFYLSALDPSISNGNGQDAHRSAGQQFSCNEKLQAVNIDFQSLVVPQWWLLANDVDLADNKLDLTNISGFGFAISPQTIKGEKVEVQIETLKFNPPARASTFNLILTIPLFCLMFILMLLIKVKQNVASKESLVIEEEKGAEPANDQTSEKQIEIVSEKKNEKLLTHREKEKNSLLKFLNEEYSNSDLSLELCTAVLGINRNKVNAILKEEVGKTFSGYLNELRLNKAAQYLIQQPDAQVSEVAYSVGYGNVSYFNKLFKSHFGCSPGSYRQDLEITD